MRKSLSKLILISSFFIGILIFGNLAIAEDGNGKKSGDKCIAVFEGDGAVVKVGDQKAWRDSSRGRRPGKSKTLDFSELDWRAELPALRESQKQQREESQSQRNNIKQEKEVLPTAQVFSFKEGKKRFPREQKEKLEEGQFEFFDYKQFPWESFHQFSKRNGSAKVSVSEIKKAIDEITPGLKSVIYEIEILNDLLHETHRMKYYSQNEIWHLREHIRYMIRGGEQFLNTTVFLERDLKESLSVSLVSLTGRFSARSFESFMKFGYKVDPPKGTKIKDVIELELRDELFKHLWSLDNGGLSLVALESVSTVNPKMFRLGKYGNLAKEQFETIREPFLEMMATLTKISRGYKKGTDFEASLQLTERLIEWLESNENLALLKSIAEAQKNEGLRDNVQYLYEQKVFLEVLRDKFSGSI